VDIVRPVPAEIIKINVTRPSPVCAACLEPQEIVLPVLLGPYREMNLPLPMPSVWIGYLYSRDSCPFRTTRAVRTINGPVHTASVAGISRLLCKDSQNGRR
jgi:hypothetical protein